MEYRELLNVLAERIGGGSQLTPDDSGAVVIGIDDMTLTILGIDEIDAVALSAPISEPPPEDKIERLYRAALLANFNFQGTSGATISINPETNELSLCRVLPLAILDGDSFAHAIEAFVNTLETWRKLVADFRGSVDAGESPDASSDAMPDFSPGGFLQV